MSQTWTKVYQSLEAEGRTVWKIPFPSNCVIYQIVIEQVGGQANDGSPAPLADATLRVFCSEKFMQGGSSSLPNAANPDAETRAAKGNYEIADPIPIVAGRGKFESDIGHHYANIDGEGPSTREYFIYLELSPPDGGHYVYDVTFNTGMEL